MTAPHFKSFGEFWPYYVAEHSQSTTRIMHAVGTTASLACVAALISARRWKLLPLAIVPGYGAAWLAHAFIERNKPATFDYPLWSFIADYKMVGLMIAGKMDTEVACVLRSLREKELGQDPIS